MKSRRMAGTSNSALKRKLGSTTLSVAVLILFVGLVLTALLGLVLAGLAALLALLLLTGLTALSGLTALLALVTFFIHVVCHKHILLKKRETCHAFEI
jgi:fatty acid desaturase